MIKPTVGRVVWYRPKGWNGPVQAALVTAVFSDTVVNLAAFNEMGQNYPVTSAFLLQEQLEGVPQREDAYAEWMPYQIGQAKREEHQQTVDKELGREPVGGQGVASPHVPDANKVAGQVQPAAAPTAEQLAGRTAEPGQQQAGRLPGQATPGHAPVQSSTPTPTKKL